jgi:2-oxo-4-hydroxy-4-carboxy-5-ureidoimidazoline decarboxylase
LEAFESHPRIGDREKPAAATAQSAAWSAQEQSRAAASGDSLKQALANGNREYERKFGRIFIICATGKSAAEILEVLRRRLNNDEKVELHEAAEQQRQITQVRLRKWLAQ